ncbi:hypothetical protein appser6_3930 [Actinobacillus pleuropneumoniae serovar 6 str. Femo]|uniref:Uncharacterized protein n=1 Tax=Actinobacillus pleuropneumoniae serovar 6 str. Femo TaxID=754256 RepID=A0A828PVJ0_ACTPL|nr:hypothetical protein appser6_3930 [Actinobacillus pleuropneumoniae serovar 6 str. Femo]
MRQTNRFFRHFIPRNLFQNLAIVRQQAVRFEKFFAKTHNER